MKITVWHHPEAVELEVDVNSEDVRAMLEGLEPAERVAQAMQLANATAVPLKAISDEMIAGMNPAQRKVIREFLTEQAARYHEGVE